MKALVAIHHSISTNSRQPVTNLFPLRNIHCSPFSLYFHRTCLPLTRRPSWYTACVTQCSLIWIIYYLTSVISFLRSEAFTKAVSLAQLCCSYSRNPCLMGGFLRTAEVKKNQNNKDPNTMDTKDVKANLYRNWGLLRSFRAPSSEVPRCQDGGRESQGRSSLAACFPKFWSPGESPSPRPQTRCPERKLKSVPFDRSPYGQSLYPSRCLQWPRHSKDILQRFLGPSTRPGSVSHVGPEKNQMLGKEITGDVEILYGLDWMLQWSQDKQVGQGWNVCTQAAFPKRLPAPIFRKQQSLTSVTTGKLGMHVLAFFQLHQCTWIYRTAHTHRKHFPRFLALILGYMERKSLQAFPSRRRC